MTYRPNAGTTGTGRTADMAKTAVMAMTEASKENLAPIKSPSVEAKPSEIEPIAETVEFGDVRARFQINSFSRTCLLEGLDELGYILRHEPQIAAFEKVAGRSN